MKFDSLVIFFNTNIYLNLLHRTTIRLGSKTCENVQSDGCFKCPILSDADLTGRCSSSDVTSCPLQQVTVYDQTPRAGLNSAFQLKEVVKFMLEMMMMMMMMEWLPYLSLDPMGVSY